MYYVDLSGVLSRLDEVILSNNIQMVLIAFTCVCLIFSSFRIRSKGGLI